VSDTTAPGARDAATTSRRHSVCPWYLGYFLVSPVRRLLENPERLLQPFVRPGMTVLEPGCGMGFFSVPLARLVGPDGRVVCVDLQQKMIDGLRRRANRAGLSGRIETIVCGPDDLGAGAWTGRVDLALAIHVVHEIPDAARFFRQIHTALRQGGRFLIVEPKGHVTPAQFAVTIATAEAAGFTSDAAAPPVSKSLGVVLAKQDGPGV
jgi:ubiquinone/menaquinone biosynthesis C-methylase UbiE